MVGGVWQALAPCARLLRRLSGSLVAASVITGCTLVPPAKPSELASADSSFELSGRFAVRMGTEGGSGRLLWQHSSTNDDLSILSPLGQGLARIVRADSLYTLTTSQNVQSSAADPDALTERALGWRLPISGLPYWLRGRAQPGSDAQTKLDEQSRIAELRQDGWVIEYLSYHADSGLPERMRVRRDTLDLRLVLEEWKRQ